MEFIGIHELLWNAMEAAQFQPRQFFEWRDKLVEHTSIHYVKAKALMARNGFKVMEGTSSCRVVGVATSEEDPRWEARLTFEACPVSVGNGEQDTVHDYTLELSRRSEGAYMVVRKSEHRPSSITLSFSGNVSQAERNEMYRLLYTMYDDVRM